MHALLAVLEKHEAWLPRLRSGEGKGETGEGTVEGRERGREGERERGREGKREGERVSRERICRDPTDRRLPALN